MNFLSRLYVSVCKTYNLTKGGMTVIDLCNCKVGSVYRISKLILDSKARAHLGALGLTKNASIRVSARTRRAVIVETRGARIALSGKISSRIVIE